MQRNMKWTRMMIYAVIRTESGFDEKAQSDVGARGAHADYRGDLRVDQTQDRKR